MSESYTGKDIIPFSSPARQIEPAPRQTTYVKCVHRCVHSSVGQDRKDPNPNNNKLILLIFLVGAQGLEPWTR